MTALSTVRLLELPVQVHARAQVHGDELMREFRLMSAGTACPGSLPARLVELGESLTGTYSPHTTRQETQIEDAVEAGAVVLDEVVFTVPPQAGAASRALAAMLDEADDFCRSGQHLLTLATPAHLVTYRHWYLGEFIRQVGGEAAVPWPRYAGSQETPAGSDEVGRPGR